jgi:uncharacterized caspase-like protein
MKHRMFGLILRLSALAVASVFVGQPCLAASAGVVAPEPRLALVIGEAGYRPGALPTSANDAGLAAQALAESGFTVTAYADLSAGAIRRAFASFIAEARRAGPDAAVAVYLSGYGVQFDGRNFFVPVEAKISRDIDVPAQAVNLADFSRDLDRLPLKARISFFDLARANAFLREDPPLASGLAMDAPPPGSIEVFNTAPGAVVSPGEGDYGPFASALAGVITRSGLGVEDMLRLLRLRVTALTNGAAVPFVEGRLERVFAFVPPAPAVVSNPASPPLASFAPSAAFWEAIERDTLQDYAAFLGAYPGDPQAPRVEMLLAARREALIWAQTCRSGTAPAYWTYMRRYPRGPHFADARRLLAAVLAPLEPPPRFELFRYQDVPPPRAGELELINRPFVFPDDQDEAAIPPPPAAILPPDLVASYDRLPPLLPLDVNDLPLPFPVRPSEVFETGRIFEPGSGEGVPVRVGQGIDKSGHLFLVQEGPDRKVLSRATMTGNSYASGTLSQTGPAGAVIWTATAASIHASRTTMQRGPNHELLSAKLVELEEDGSRKITFSGPDDLPVSVVKVNASGMIVPVKDSGGSRFTSKPVLARPTVLQAKPPAGVSAPAKVAAPVRPAPAVPPSSVRSAPAADLAVPVAPAEPVAPTGVDVKPFAPLTVPEPKMPEVLETHPTLVPEPGQPVIAAPGDAAVPRQPESPALPLSPKPAEVPLPAGKRS